MGAALQLSVDGEVLSQENGSECQKRGKMDGPHGKPKRTFSTRSVEKLKNHLPLNDLLRSKTIKTLINFY